MKRIHGMTAEPPLTSRINRGGQIYTYHVHDSIDIIVGIRYL